ncbi:MAG: hypothetical protein U0800_04835 [Isosphaeraceae bacterium]
MRVRGTIAYVLGRMTDPEGAYATEDADSEGRRCTTSGPGPRWIPSSAPKPGATFAAAYDVQPVGNWEGHSILNRSRPPADTAKALGRVPADLEGELDRSRALLLEARERREPPGKDTKVLASWNGLMIAALADAGRVLGDGEAYLDAALRASAFILGRMRTVDGRLLHVFKDEQARLAAYLDDYAAMIDGLTRLFEATGDPRWIREAMFLAEILIEDFNADEGGFFYTAKGHESLIVRQKDLFDNATPSGNGLAATALARLSALTGRADLEDRARSALQAARLVMEKAPAAAGQSLIALDFLVGPRREIAVISGDDPAEFRSAKGRISAPFRPWQVVAPAPVPPPADLARLVPLLAGRPSIEGRATTYVCRDESCEAPIIGVDGLASIA